MAAVPPPTGDWLALPAPVHADLSPDGSRLAVTTVRVPRGTEDEITRLAVVSVADGKVSGLPAAVDGDGSAVWSPAGDRLAFVTGRAARAAGLRRSPGAQHRPHPAVPRARAITRAVAWGDGMGLLDDPPQLWIVDLDTGAVEQLTDDEWRSSRPRWSPDGTTLAVRVSHDPAGHRRGQHMRLVQLDGSWEAPPVPGGSYVAHDWSALGLLAVLVVQPTNRELGSQGQLHVIGPDGVRELTAAVPFGAGGDVYGDSPAALGDGYDAALAVDGATAWVRVTDGGRLGVARVGLTDEPPVWTQVVSGERCVTPVGVRGGRLVVAAQSATEPCRFPRAAGRGRRTVAHGADGARWADGGLR